MKIGIICSSGGSAFAETLNILRNEPYKYEFFVITDRKCGIKNICEKNDIKHTQIDDLNNRGFSTKAKLFFDECGGVDFVTLFFLRLVTKELFLFYPTFNIHPALLPAFKGFNAVQRAMKEKVKFLGATLHLVDESTDGGQILAQVCMPIKDDYTEEMLNKFSFIQKVYLLLVLVEIFNTNSIKLADNNSYFKITNNMPYTDRCNPSLRNSNFLNGVINLQKREGVRAI